MLRFGEAIRTKVVARDSAEQLGEVRHFVVDPASQRISALHVAGRNRKARLVDWAALSGFGRDAVVVGSSDALRGPADDRERAVVSDDLDLDRRRILSDRGDELGRLDDVEFDESSGQLRAIRTTDDTEVAADRLRQIGPYCVLVRADGGA